MGTPKAVLLAGGGGERFWPSSRPWFPKQFLDLDGSGSLIQGTYRRVRKWLRPEDIWVITAAKHAHLVREQLTELPAGNLILEPEGRDTAPCLGLVALFLERLGPDTVMVALPADHFIADDAPLIEALKSAAAAAAAGRGLITLGLRPARPDTGYGYMQMGTRSGPGDLYDVQRFVEKPNATTAKHYLERGDFLWNSGIFAWRVDTFLDEVHRHLPELHAVLAELRRLGGTDLQAALPRVFPKAPRISVDYGILEKSTQVRVLPVDFAWDDVGTWAAVDRIRAHDGDGNSVRGQALLQDVRNVLIESSTVRTVAAVGVSDLVIVDAEDALLVCHKDRVQDVRIVAAQAGRLPPQHAPFPAAPEGQVVEKPWGREVWWAVTDQYVGKILEVQAGQSLSLQYHVEKLETLYFQVGRGQLRMGDLWLEVGPGKVVTVTPGTVHQLVARTHLVVIEVSTPQLHDVVRLSDWYGRAGDATGMAAEVTADVAVALDTPPGPDEGEAGEP